MNASYIIGSALVGFLGLMGHNANNQPRQQQPVQRIIEYRPVVRQEVQSPAPVQYVVQRVQYQQPQVQQNRYWSSPGLGSQQWQRQGFYQQRQQQQRVVLERRCFPNRQCMIVTVLMR